MKIPNPGFPRGLTWIARFDERPWEDPLNPKMSFGILRLAAGDAWTCDEALEKALLLMTGRVSMTWPAGDDGVISRDVSRGSIFDDDPWCLHVPFSVAVEVKALEASELAIVLTTNDKHFPARLHAPADCASDLRGAGTMRETSTRFVRTIFDGTTEPRANLVLGEVINYPGKWSSYPPHHHPQPEIYHYRFLPPHGFGFSMLGDDAVQVKDGDTVLIFNKTHSQAAAPGYAMYYIWPIRHLDGNPYTIPVFEEQHLWVTKKENEANIWPPEAGKQGST